MEKLQKRKVSIKAELFIFTKEFISVPKKAVMAEVIDKQIIASLPLLGREEKESILSVIKSYLHLKAEVGRVSVTQYNKELEAAEKRIDAGKFITQEDVEKEATLW